MNIAADRVLEAKASKHMAWGSISMPKGCKKKKHTKRIGKLVDREMSKPSRRSKAKPSGKCFHFGEAEHIL